jgi:hypothetical protein
MFPYRDTVTVAVMHLSVGMMMMLHHSVGTTTRHHSVNVTVFHKAGSRL